MSLVHIVCCHRSVRRPDPSSRGILPNEVCHFMRSRNLKNEATLARIRLLCHGKGNYLMRFCLSVCLSVTVKVTDVHGLLFSEFVDTR